MIESRPRRGSPLITAVALAAQGMVGVFHTILGTALPAIRADLNLDLIQAGAFGGAAWLGFTFSILAGGLLADLIPRPRVVRLGCLMIGLGAVTFGEVRSLALNLLLIALVGGGTGVVTSGATALLMGLHPGREGIYTSVLHFFYALGTMGGAAGMAYLLEAGGDWRLIYHGAGVFLFLLAVLPAEDKIAGRSGGPGLRAGDLLGLLQERTMWLLLLAMLLGVGNQNGLSYWLVSFLTEVRALSIFAAGMGLTLFSVGMLAGRLLAGLMSVRYRIASILLILTAGLNAAVFLLLRQGDPVAALIWCFLAGLGFSALFPFLMTLGGLAYPGHQGTAVGLLGAAAGVGSTLVPWLISLVSSVSSLKSGLWVSQAAALLVFVLAGLLKRRRIQG
ncbi:MAG: MFS transporter [Thermodesulfobacteriota bacterium]